MNFTRGTSSNESWGNDEIPWLRDSILGHLPNALLIKSASYQKRPELAEFSLETSAAILQIQNKGYRNYMHIQYTLIYGCVLADQNVMYPHYDWGLT